MKIFGPLRLTGKLDRKSGFCVAFVFLTVLSLSYLLLPKLLFKSKLPPSHVGRMGTYTSLVERDTKKLSFWDGLQKECGPVRILNSDTCVMLQQGTTQQSTSSVFKGPCRISFDRRYLDASDALVFHSYDLMRYG